MLTLRAAATLLDEQIGRTSYVYQTQLWQGELAFLEWSASTNQASIEEGADSYWIQGGKIRAMTAHHTVKGQ